DAAALARAAAARRSLRRLCRRRLAARRLLALDARGGLHRRRGAGRGTLRSGARRLSRWVPGARGVLSRGVGQGAGPQALTGVALRAHSKRRAATDGPPTAASALAPKRGDRFSTNARTPSSESALAQHIACASDSAARHSASVR